MSLRPLQHIAESEYPSIISDYTKKKLRVFLVNTTADFEVIN